MKKFKFKLEGLLKLRKFDEQKIKMEIGQIVSEIEAVKQRIVQINQDIEEGYKARDMELEGNQVTGEFLHFFPMFLQGKKDDIQNNENLITALMRKYNAKILELNQARGKVKVVENLKEKDFESFRKAEEKKEEEKIQDILIMRRNGRA